MLRIRFCYLLHEPPPSPWLIDKMVPHLRSLTDANMQFLRYYRKSRSHLDVSKCLKKSYVDLNSEPMFYFFFQELLHFRNFCHFFIILYLFSGILYIYLFYSEFHQKKKISRPPPWIYSCARAWLDIIYFYSLTQDYAKLLFIQCWKRRWKRPWYLN